MESLNRFKVLMRTEVCSKCKLKNVCKKLMWCKFFEIKLYMFFQVENSFASPKMFFNFLEKVSCKFKT